MTREEEITNACIDFKHEAHPEGAGLDYAFFRGIMWADSHPHWINVEDELPPRFPLNPNESMNVLTYGLHTMVNWYDYERGEWVRDSEITHWMPLPQPPKEGGEE